MKSAAVQLKAETQKIDISELEVGWKEANCAWC